MMGGDWLTFQSFQRSQELLKAINSLSIHLKLTLRGIEDEERSQIATESIRTLERFLNKLEQAAAQPSHEDRRVILGVDPRFQELVQSYLAARLHHRVRSRLFEVPLTDVKLLLKSGAPDDKEALVGYLSDLRTLVEEHMHDDTGELLGAI